MCLHFSCNTMHINSMPDLVLRRIFSKVPLRDLLNGRRVCLLWNSYCIETRQQVRSLSLLIGSSSAQSLITTSCFTLKYRDLLLNDDGTRMYSPQYLPKHFHLTNFGSFSPKFSNQLVNTFPQITTLEIAIKVDQFKSVITQSVICLLTKWSPNLKSLKIYLNIEGRFAQSPLLTDVKTKEGKLVNLLKVFNSLSSLEHLTLNYNGAFFDNSLSDLSIFGQLREFYIESHDFWYSIEKSLKKYSLTNCKLQQIGIEMLSKIDFQHYCYTLKSISPTFYQKFPQLQNKVVYISPPQLLNRMENLNHDILSFTSITSFCMCPQRNENIFTGALNFLTSLEQLVQLELNFVFSSGYFSSLQFHINSHHQVFLDQMAQLSSIQVLTLGCFECHDYLNFTSKFDSNDAWAYLFPAVQVILLKITNTLDNTQLDVSEIQDSLDTFKGLPKLAHLRVYIKEIVTTPSGRQSVGIREWFATRNS